MSVRCLLTVGTFFKFSKSERGVGIKMIWMILGGTCLLYFIVLFSIGMDFSVIWLLGGLALFGWGTFHFFGRWHMPGGLRIGIGVLAGICMAVFVGVEILIFTGMFSKGEGNLDYLIVLGAQVRGTEPSRALKKRLNTAVTYLLENPDTMAVVSGGMGSGEEITEAEAMEAYLLEKGISKDRIIREDQSTSTVENIDFTAKLIDREKRIGLVTNNFHVYRAVSLAKKQGYTHVCGLAAPSDPAFQVHYLVREFFAMIKEWVIGNI